MNKITLLACLIISVSCAHHRGPASVDKDLVSQDSTAFGSIEAHAVKQTQKHEVCFDVNLTAKDIKPEHAQASNWTFAWVDKNDQYHLLNQKHRGPASTPVGGTKVLPYGSYTSYSNNFSTCLPAAKAKDMKALVLTAKELPYEKSDLRFSWTD